MTFSTAFSLNREARGVAIETQYEALQSGTPKGRPVKLYIPCIASADKSIAAEPYDYVSLADTGTKFGYDSTAYQTMYMLDPPNATSIASEITATLFPCEVATGAQASGDVTPTGTATKVETYKIKVNNIYANDVVTEVGDAVADWIDKAVVACNAVLRFPMTATDGTTTLDLEAGVESAAGNHLYIEIESPDDAEFTFVVTQPTGGAGTVDYAAALTAMGETWYSHLINAIDDVTNTTLLDALKVAGDAKWEPEVKIPFKAYTGTNEATLATVTAITSARSSDKINSIKHNPASNDLPWAIAGRMVAVQANIANADPAQDYDLAECSLLTVGAAASQLTSAQRQQAVTSGLSTIEIKNGVVCISDAVMCYRPAGEDPPGYQYDCDIEKLCYMITNLDLIFSNPADAGNPAVPDGQVTKNPNARKPSYYKTKIFKLYKGASEAAIIADLDYAKENTTVTLSGKRYDTIAVYKLSGNGKIFAVTNKFSHYGGEA